MSYYTVALPTVSVTPGPLWAATLNQILTLVEGHGHTGSDETRITPSAININADLTFNTAYRALNLKSSQYATQSSAPAGGTFARGIYVVTNGGVSDLYYDNGTTAIAITNGNAIVPTGTGAANGFYGDYASVVAKAYFDNSTNQYRFFKDNLTTRSKLVADSLILRTASATGITLQKTDSTGGFALAKQSDNSLQVLFDSSSAGTYNVSGLALYPLGFNNQYGLLVNSAPTADTQAFGVWYQTSNAATTALHSYFNWRTAAGSGSYTNNVSGYRIQYRSEYGSSNSGNYGVMGALQPFWSDASAPRGGLRIQTARGATSSPTYNGTAFIELSDNLSAIGIGGAATGNGLVTMYGSIVPPTTNTQTIGNNTFAFNTVYTRALATDTGALTVSSNVSASGTMTVAGNLTATTTSTLTGDVTFNSFLIPGNSAGSTSHGKFNYNSFVTAFITFNDSTTGGAFNATVVNNSAGNNTITFPFTLAANATYVAVAQDANVTVQKVSGGGGSNTLRVATSDTANHTVTVVVFGG